jgi:peptide subunit release factor 1 (eRF1)
MPGVIPKERLRELAAYRPVGQKVLSLYLNLDPSEFPTPRDRATELESLLDNLEAGLREDSIGHAQRESLKRDVERIRSFFANEFDASGTRGVVVFASSDAGLFEVVRLPRPIASEAVIDDSPFIEPLTTLPGADAYCVLLINRQVARILVGGAEQMREVATIVDEVHGRHDQGGWSQARYQRSIENEAQHHVRRAAEQLFRRFKRGQVQRLVVGATEELRGDVETALHSYLRDRIAGWLEVDVQAPPADVAKELRPLIERDEQERERSWLDRLQSELGRNARGVSGLAATLSALNEKRVEAILIREGLRAPGYATPASDFLSTEPGTSATGEQLQQRDDVIEPALESALEQSAEIVVVRHHPDLEAHESIGAVLRF